MRFIHVGDIHASRERYEVVSKVLNHLIARCSNGNVDSLLICGDFWDSTITNTEASNFTNYLNLMNQLCKLTKVVMIYGTPSHEPAGSLEVFKYVGAEVIDSYIPGYRIVETKKGLFELVSLPEPRLSTLKGNSLEDKHKFNSDMYEYFALSISKKDKEYPRICMFHNEVAGMNYQNGEKIKASSLSLTESYLKRLNCDYYAGAHIHLPQNLKTIPGGYCGSSAPIDFGEKHDACYIEVEI